MGLFPTKFVCDVDVLTYNTDSTVTMAMTVNGTTVLSEKYSPADGSIVVRGLRSVLEAAIHGDLTVGTQSAAKAAVVVTIGGSQVAGKTLYAARLKNPRDPLGAKTVLTAGDLTAVVVARGNALRTAPLLSTISSGNVVTAALQNVSDGMSIGDGLKLWVDYAPGVDECTCVRFLNRYDVPQTMMTPRALEIKPAFEDKTALMYGRRVRYTVDQQDEYVLRSGRIHRMEEYASWADLVTSRKAEVLMGSQWVPIIVTKSNFTAIRRETGLNPVEITFRMADPKQGM